MRFSWCISNSYSKSEIARSPLTIVLAPTLRAKSTTRMSNGSARTLLRSLVADSMKAIRSSMPNSGWVLRVERLTTAMTTSSNSSAARWMMSRWPLVIGS